MDDEAERLYCQIPLGDPSIHALCFLQPPESLAVCLPYEFLSEQVIFIREPTSLLVLPSPLLTTMQTSLE